MRRRRGPLLRRDSSGFVSMYTAAVLVALVGMVGLTLDSGLLFRDTSDAFGLAAAAARAGAQQLDDRHAVQTGEAIIDETAAQAEVERYVEDYLERRGERLGVSVDQVATTLDPDDPTQLTVAIEGRTEFAILPFPDKTYRVSATVTAHQGAP